MEVDFKKKQPPYVELLIHLNQIINFAKTDLYPLEVGNEKFTNWIFMIFDSDQQYIYMARFCDNMIYLQRLEHIHLLNLMLNIL